MKQFAVIGLGRFGSSVANTLYNMGFDVLAIDTDQDKVDDLAERVTHAVQADAQDEDVLKKLGIRNFDVVIVAIGQDIQSNILVTVTLKELGVKYVVAKAQNDLHGKVLEKVGADKVVYPERDMGYRLAHSIGSASIMDYIELSPTHSIMELRAPGYLLGKTLGKADLRAKYGITVIAVKKKDDIIASPGAETLVEDGDILVAIGSNDDLNHFEEDARK